MSNKIIGIDLGSTASAVSVIENGKPTIVANSEGNRTTPSVIGLKDGSPSVGESAKRQQIVNPKETIILIKRFMGSTYDEAKEATQHVDYDVVNNNGLPRVKINGREYSPEELSSMIISKMKKTAEDYLGEEVTRAVITVPAYFNDSQRNATKAAGELAGLTVERIIAEPTAAILSSNIDMSKDGNYMVVDYGGATLDFSVANIGDNVVEILASHGDVYNGGSDIDRLIANDIVSTFKKESDIDLSKDVMAYSRIYEAAEKAKIELSSTTSTDINLPYITVKDGTPIHLNYTITRAKFNKLISPIIDKLIECGKVALKESGLTIDELDSVILVGGSCRIPYLQEQLTKHFCGGNDSKLNKSLNLDEAVSLGAAVQGGIISGDSSSDLLLLDVIAIPYGIETMGGVMTNVVEANTTIPCKKAQTFTTAVDNQPSIEVVVLQGLRPMAKDNKVVGRFVLDGILPAKRGIPQIEITMDINANGILSVTAKDKGTGKEQHVTIETKGQLTDDDIERIKKEAEDNAEADKKEKDRIDTINECDSIIWQSEKQIEELGDKIESSDKSNLVEKIDELKKMKENGDYSNFNNVKSEIDSIWQSISSKIYIQNSGEQMSDMFKNGGSDGFNVNDSNGSNSTNSSQAQDVF